MPFLQFALIIVCAWLFAHLECFHTICSYHHTIVCVMFLSSCSHQLFLTSALISLPHRSFDILYYTCMSKEMEFSQFLFIFCHWNQLYYSFIADHLNPLSWYCFVIAFAFIGKHLLSRPSILFYVSHAQKMLLRWRCIFHVHSFLFVNYIQVLDYFCVINCGILLILSKECRKN